jgi:hypothetical protein
MVKRSQRSSKAGPGAHEASAQPSTATATSPEPAPATKRRPYQRPVVQKRRSIAEATLFSASGVSGTLIS